MQRDSFSNHDVFYVDSKKKKKNVHGNKCTREKKG